MQKDSIISIKIIFIHREEEDEDDDDDEIQFDGTGFMSELQDMLSMYIFQHDCLFYY